MILEGVFGVGADQRAVVAIGQSILPGVDSSRDHYLNGGTKDRRLIMVHWKSERFWLGKLLEHPEIMTQGESLEEHEENLKDAYFAMAMDDVCENYQTKEITL